MKVRKYETIRSRLLDEIATRLGPGQLFHTQRELMERFHTGYATIARVIAELKARGVIESRPRKGLFVRQVPAALELAPVTICLFTRLPRVHTYEIGNAFHEGLTLAAQEMAFALRLLPLQEDADRMLADFGAAGGRGILFVQDEHPSFIRRVHAEGIPYVVVHPYHEKFSNSIEIDDGYGVQQAILGLAARGARRILFLCEQMFRAHDYAKLDGYFSGLAAAGLPRDDSLVAQTGQGSVLDLLNCCREVAARRADYDALLAMTPRLLEFLDSVFEPAGIRIPEDVRVAVYGDWGYAASVAKPLGVVHIPHARAAREGMARLLRACRDPGYIPGTHLLQPDFAWRDRGIEQAT